MRFLVGRALRVVRSVPSSAPGARRCADASSGNGSKSIPCSVASTSKNKLRHGGVANCFFLMMSAGVILSSSFSASIPFSVAALLAGLLARRIGETGLGIRPAQETKRYRYEEARAALLADYEAKGRSSLVTRADGKKTICGLTNLDDYYAGRSLASINADDVRDFIRQRQAEGAGAAIINRVLLLDCRHQRS